MANSPGHSLQSASHDPERFTFRRPLVSFSNSVVVTCGCEQNLDNQDNASLKSRESYLETTSPEYMSEQIFFVCCWFREAGVCSHRRPANDCKNWQKSKKHFQIHRQKHLHPTTLPLGSVATFFLPLYFFVLSASCSLLLQFALIHSTPTCYPSPKPGHTNHKKNGEKKTESIHITGLQCQRVYLKESH